MTSTSTPELPPLPERTGLILTMPNKHNVCEVLWEGSMSSDKKEPIYTAEQMREYAALSRAQAAAQPAEQCDQAFDDWYAAQRHQLTNEQVCRLIWTRGWEARGADNPEMDGTDAAHPAWWRSHDHTFAVMCEKLEKLLDGEPVVGATEPRWQRIRKRIAALVAAQPVRNDDRMVGFPLWLTREEWGVVIDGLILERERSDRRKEANSASNSDVRAEMCENVIAKINVESMTLRAQPAALQGQPEPVGKVFTMEALVPGGETKCHVTLFKPLPAGTKLYTAPPAPSVTNGWISVKDRLPAPGQRIHGLSDAHAWIETFDPREPFGRMTHWKPHEETPESAPSAGEPT